MIKRDFNIFFFFLVGIIGPGQPFKPQVMEFIERQQVSEILHFFPSPLFLEKCSSYHKVFEHNSVRLIVKLYVCNMMTKMLQVSAFAGDPPFSAWLFPDLSGMGDKDHADHQVDGEHLKNTP
jgi:hypothetical protein